MKKLFRFIDRMSAIYLIVVFTALVLAFAFAYALLTPINHGIKPSDAETLWEALPNSIYFSVITISSLGFGDFHPVGIAKILVCCQVLVGLLFLGIVVSKLVSSKSNYLLRRIYSSDMHLRLTTFSVGLDEITKEYSGLKKRVSALSDDDNTRLFGGRQCNIHEDVVSRVSGLRRFLSHESEQGEPFRDCNPASFARTLEDLRDLLVVLSSKPSIRILRHKGNVKRLRNTSRAASAIVSIVVDSGEARLEAIGAEIKKLSERLWNVADSN